MRNGFYLNLPAVCVSFYQIIKFIYFILALECLE